jgi:RHS repeat-associated protein
MPTKSYYSVGGRIIGERTQGGSRVDYLTGPVGSVTATVNDSGAVVNRYRYKPYGALLSKSGAGADPKFLWAGSFGYRQTSVRFSEAYVRGRHFSTTSAGWTSVDQYWPVEPPYGYARANPTNHTDPSGRIPKLGPGCNECETLGRFPESVASMNTILGRLCNNYLGNVDIQKCINDCTRNLKKPDCIEKFCKSNKVIECYARTTAGRCERKYPTACPQDCRVKEINTIPCAQTNIPCDDFWLCCPSAEEDRALCGCPANRTPFSCEHPVGHILHELHHICSADCSRDHTGHPQDRFANCIRDCFKGGLFNPPNFVPKETIGGGSKTC